MTALLFALLSLSATWLFLEGLYERAIPASLSFSKIWRVYLAHRLSRFDHGYGVSGHGRNGFARKHYGSTGATRVSGIAAEPVEWRWIPLEPRGAAFVTRHLACTIPVHGPQQTDRFKAEFLPTKRPNLRPMRVEACSLERLLPSGTHDLNPSTRLHDI